MVVLVALDNARQMREKQTQLLKLRNEPRISQLNALKKQLQPHFPVQRPEHRERLMDENIDGARRCSRAWGSCCGCRWTRNNATR